LCVAVCKTRKEGINRILELKPNVVFLSINSVATTSDSITFSLLSELHEFLDELPTIIVLSDVKEAAFEAYQRGVSGYLLTPIDSNELRKCLMRYQKTHKTLHADTISIKSNGDYNFIRSSDIVYLKADSNTTDFHLKSGKVISAYKTLKHFEKLLPFYFLEFIMAMLLISNMSVGLIWVKAIVIYKITKLYFLFQEPIRPTLIPSFFESPKKMLSYSQNTTCYSSRYASC